MKSYENAVMEFDEEIGKLADMMTYDEFVSLEISDLQHEGSKIVGIDKIDNVTIIEFWAYCIHERVSKWMFVVQNSADINMNEIQERYGYDCLLSVFDDKESIKNLVYSLLECSRCWIPPAAYSFKEKLDILVKDFDDVVKQVAFRKKVLIYNTATDEHPVVMWARNIVDKYYDNLANNNYEKYFYYLVYGCSIVYEIVELEVYRGCYNEQRILADAIRTMTNFGKKIILILWDLDLGFERLSSDLEDLITNGKVELNLQRYKNSEVKVTWSGCLSSFNDSQV